MNLFLRLCFISFFLFASCTPDLEPNTRILVKGVVSNSDGLGLSGHEVTVFSRHATGFFFSYGQDDYLLGSGTTAADGSFSITSLFDRDDEFTIAIKGQNSYLDYSYTTNSFEYVPSNLKFDLGNVILRESAVVNYSITRNSVPGTTFSYYFTYQNPRCVEVYEEGMLDTQLSDCYSDQIMAGELNDTNPDVSREFTTILGSVVTFNYIVNDQQMLPITFTVDQTDFTYEFIY